MEDPVGNMLPEAVEKLVAEMSTEEKRSLAQALMRMVAAEHAGGLGADVLLVSQVTPEGEKDVQSFEQALREEGDQTPVVTWPALA